MELKEQLTLEFKIVDGLPMLVSFTCRRGRSFVSAEPSGIRRFSWKRSGVRVLALVLVRLARWKHVPAGRRPEVLPLLSSRGRPSCAASLGDAVMKAGAIHWPSDMCSLSEPPDSEEAAANLRRWLEFGNVQGKRKDSLMTVGGIWKELPPEAVTILLDGANMEGHALDSLERRLAGTLDGSLPPLNPIDDISLAGYFPCAGPEFWNREREVDEISMRYESGKNRALVILGPAGIGKTAVVREWLGERIASKSLRQKLVFGWSFYRQGHGGLSGQLLTEFYEELSKALGAELEDRMLPAETASVLWKAMTNRSALLILDGLEVLQREDSQQLGGIHDGALGLLLHMLITSHDPHQCYVIATSRTPLRDAQGWSFPEVQHLLLRQPKKRLEKEDIHEGREASGAGRSALEWSLSEGRKKQAMQRSELVVKEAEAVEGDGAGLLPLLREALETFGDSPERAILLAAAVYDRPPHWEDLHWLLTSSPPLRNVTAGWFDASLECWENALERLQECRLLQMDAGGLVVLHPAVVECLAAEIRASLPDVWREAHLRLREYFASIPESYTPETLAEMEPLFRGAWHGCQAGDHQRTVDNLTTPRISRGTSGYVVKTLGATQAALTLLECFTADHRTFAVGCDLNEETRILILMGCAFCLHDLGRLAEAYEVCKAAWSRIQPKHDVSCVGPAATNLMRLQLMYGDAADSKPVMKRLANAFANTKASSGTYGVPPSFFAEAIGVSGSVSAALLFMRGYPLGARTLLWLTLKRCRSILGTHCHLVPGSGAVIHAMTLLDMGLWKHCASAEENGELELLDFRDRAAGLKHLILGRLRSEQAKSVSATVEKRKRGAEAFQELMIGLEMVQANGLHWWHANFHLALARHHHAMKAWDDAHLHKLACEEISQRENFRNLVALNSKIVLPKSFKKASASNLAPH